MVVKIVTDSGADLPEEVTKDLDITVVPLHFLFGKKDYRDGVDINPDEFYVRLIHGPVHPTTSTASPGEFANVFRRLIREGAKSIICISISSKLSKTYGSAVQAQKDLVGIEAGIRPIAVIDSENIAMGTGLLAIMAARLAKEGKSQTEIINTVKENISRVHLMGVLDTLKYLIRGGRAPKIAVVSDILKIKTFLKLKEGELHAAGRTRLPLEKKSCLIRFVYNLVGSGIEEVAVEYSTNKEEAEMVKKTIEITFPEMPVFFGRLGPVLGVHAGPGVIAVSVRTKR